MARPARITMTTTRAATSITDLPATKHNREEEEIDKSTQKRSFQLQSYQRNWAEGRNKTATRAIEYVRVRRYGGLGWSESLFVLYILVNEWYEWC